VEAQAGAADRRGRRASTRGRSFDLATRLALVAVVAGPSLLCAALVSSYTAHPSAVVIAVETTTPAVADTQPAPSCVETKATTNEPDPTSTAPVVPSPSRAASNDAFVAAMSPWGVVLSNDAKAELGTGRVVPLEHGAAKGTAEVASKAVELALVDEAFRDRVGTPVIAWGRDGEVCRGVVGTPRLVRAFNGWHDMLGEEEPRLAVYDDEPPKVTPKMIRNAVWAHVEETFLVAPILDPSTGHVIQCEDAAIVTQTTAAVEALHRIDEPRRDELVSARIADFLASPEAREVETHYAEHLASLDTAFADEDGDVEPPLTWDAFVARNLRVRGYVQRDGRLAALAISLEDLEAEGCGSGFWGSAARLERLDETGQWHDIGRSFPDAAIVTPAAFIDATRVLDLDDGIHMHVRWLRDLPARAAMLTTPRDPEGPDLAAAWDLQTSEGYSAFAYFEGCPC
jgi:hypothetical protein